MQKEYIVNSLEETQSLAKQIAKELNCGDCVLLFGEIGAGKTTFTKFLLDNLGVKSIVSSPTFTLLNEYSGDYPIYHFDMYRITSSDELYELGFEDYIDSKNSKYVKSGLTLIEWPENVADILPKNRIEINIDKLSDTSRKFIIKN